ncbi:tetratricopeptide repeat protein [Domibacillus iocasae]|nr:tetratricopeptide repeat protein [Domibacillus iocasae]
MSNITDGTIRWVIAGFLFVILIGLIYTYTAAKSQDEVYLQNYSKYEKAVELFEAQQFDQALPLFEELEKEQPRSAVIKNYLGIAYVNTGNVDAAITKYQNVLDLNPYKVEDAQFMIQFGEILLFADQKDDAKKVLEKCLTLVPPAEMPDYHEKVNQLLAQTQS